MNENLTEHDLAPNHEQFLSEALHNGQLHKIFMVCPYAEQHMKIAHNGEIAFSASFLEYLNGHLDNEPIYFYEDNPFYYHRFSKPSHILLAFLLSPDKIISVDGRLSLRKNNVTLDNIVGAYLFNDSEKFYPHVDFNPVFIKQRMN